MKKLFVAAAVISAVVWSCKSSVTGTTPVTSSAQYVYFNRWPNVGVLRIGIDALGLRTIAQSAYISTSPANDNIVMIGGDSASGATIYIVHPSQLNNNTIVIGKVAIPVYTGISWGHAVLSPDGAHIALLGYYQAATTDSSALYWMDVDSSHGHMAPTSGAYEALPAFSHDGTRIAYFGGDLKMHTMNLDGSNAHAFGNYTRVDNDYFSRLEWFPSDDHILYSTTKGDCYVATPDGGNIVDLGIAISMTMPALSPSGTQIAYSAGGLNIANTSGGSVQIITPTTPTQFDGFPMWTADEKKIVFTSYPMTGGKLDMDMVPGTLNIVDIASKNVSKLADSVSRQAYLAR